MKKILCIVMALCCVFMSAFCVSAESAQPIMEQGILSLNDADLKDDPAGLRTADYIELAEYEGIGIKKGYEIINFVYDIDKDFLGTSGWLGDGVGFTTAKLTAIYPMGVYFKFAIRKTDGSQISIIEAASVSYYTLGQEMPESVTQSSTDFSAEEIMDIGDWEDGAIYDNKLFALGARGSCAVFDLETKEKISDISVEGDMMMAINTNAVSFSSTYYQEGDKYPLLYANLYTEYHFGPMSLGGICCVFRITESEGVFSLSLVQLIRIGFSEDSDLWKSTESEGYENSSGNFVVDADKNELYAFVARGKEKVTRFFKFALPAMDAGETNQFLGCSEVVLNEEDIIDQFDLQYFYNMQGCDYIGGKIISAEGLGPSTYAATAIRVVDLNQKAVVRSYYPATADVLSEPAMIATDCKTGYVYYGTGDGTLRKLTCLEANLIETEEAESSKTKAPIKMILWIIVISVAVILLASAILMAFMQRKSE